MSFPTLNFQLSTLTNQLPDLPDGPLLARVRGPVEIPSYETYQIIMAVACLLGFVGLLTWLFYRNRERLTPLTPPYEAAIEELKTASELTGGDDERFAILCSQALRRYLENGHGLKFSARTSEEFLLNLKDNNTLETNYQNELTDVLGTFDRIKFARANIHSVQRNEILNTVRSLIDRAHEKNREKGGRR
ncbi:MAG: hypothetical protein ACPGGN_01585 [Opitutales bacterium]